MTDRPEMPDQLNIPCNHRGGDYLELTENGDDTVSVYIKDTGNLSCMLMHRDKIPDLIFWLHQFYLATDPEDDEEDAHDR